MKDIINGRDKFVADASSALPNVVESIQELLMPIIATVIQKQQINGYTQEVAISVKTKVSLQPFTAQQLIIKPEGQRMWRWFVVYSQNNLNLKPDDAFIIKNVRYRIMTKMDWSEYGYYAYEAIEDYQEDLPEITGE